MDGLLDFFSREAGQRRRAALDEFGRDVGYYVPPELRGLLGLAAEMTPSATIDRAAQAGGEMMASDRTPMERVGSAGRMLSETAGVAAPMMVAGRAAMPAAQALQEGLLGFSMAGQGAADAGRRFLADEAGAVGDWRFWEDPRLSKPYRKPSPYQTQWTFGDVDASLNANLTRSENKRISDDTSRIEVVPIRRLMATQDSVAPDFATTTSSSGELPLVVRKGGKMFVRDGHHRLTRASEQGAQTAKVRFIDLDNADTSTPLLDWSPEKTGFVPADDELLSQLFGASQNKGLLE